MLGVNVHPLLFGGKDQQYPFHILDITKYLQSTSQPKMSSKKGPHVSSWLKKCIRSIPTRVCVPLNGHLRAVG